MKTQYMSSIVFFDTVAQAEHAFAQVKPTGGTIVLERHQRGTAAIVWLQDKPVQPGQAQYIGVDVTS